MVYFATTIVAPSGVVLFARQRARQRRGADVAEAIGTAIDGAS